MSRPNESPKKLRPTSALRTRRSVGLGGVAIAFIACVSSGCQEQSKHGTETSTDWTSSGVGTNGESTTTTLQPTFDTAYDSAPLFTAQPPALSATVTDESTDPDVRNAPLLTCVPTKGAGENLLVDDFEDEDLLLPEEEGRSGQWYNYEEVVGDHQLENRALSSARLGSKWAAHTSGTDHGAWAGFGVQLCDCVYDVSKYVGVHFWIRGSSNPIDVALLTPGVIPVANGGTCTKEEEGGCWDSYRREVEVSEQWREVFLPFTEFEQEGYGMDAGPLDLTRLRSIEFQSDAGEFDYWVDDVRFYIEEVYTPYDPSTEEPSTHDAGSDGSSSADGAEGDAGLESSRDVTTTEDSTTTSTTSSNAETSDQGGQQ